LVDTEDGLAIVASDEVYLYRLLEESITAQIRTSEGKYRLGLDRLARLALSEKGVIVAMHDPVVWETYRRAGRHWLRALKPISDRAVEGYIRARGWRE
jgi:hypothetical protein